MGQLTQSNSVGNASFQDGIRSPLLVRMTGYLSEWPLDGHSSFDLQLIPTNYLSPGIRTELRVTVLSTETQEPL